LILFPSLGDRKDAPNLLWPSERTNYGSSAQNKIRHPLFAFGWEKNLVSETLCFLGFGIRTMAKIQNPNESASKQNIYYRLKAEPD
jgi:hypothetical protein